MAASRLKIPRWARRGSRLDRWYARSYWNRVGLVSAVSGAIIGAATASDTGEALTGALIGFLVVVFVFVWAAGSIVWRQLFVRFGRGGRPS